MLDVNGEKRLKCFEKSYPFWGLGGGAFEGWESKMKVELSDTDDLSPKSLDETWCPGNCCFRPAVGGTWVPVGKVPDDLLLAWPRRVT